MAKLSIIDKPRRSKKITWGNLHDDNVEQRPYEVHKDGFDSGKHFFFYCPFCHFEVKAYVWSICANGKRCECGALFSGYGGFGINWRD